MLTGRNVDASEAFVDRPDRPPRRARRGGGVRAGAGPRAARALAARAARGRAVGRHRRRPAAGRGPAAASAERSSGCSSSGEGREGIAAFLEKPAAEVRMTAFDVTTLRGRRSDQRWNRTAVGDLLERLTWSRPDQDAIVGAPGAYSTQRSSASRTARATRPPTASRTRCCARGPGALRPRAPVLRQLGRGAADHDRHRQGRHGRRAGQPADGARRPGLGDRATSSRASRSSTRAAGRAPTPTFVRDRALARRAASRSTRADSPSIASAIATGIDRIPADDRARRHDPRRRHLVAAVHVRHDVDAEGRDVEPHVLVHGRR